MDNLTSRIIEFYDKISSWEHSVVRDSGLTPAQMHAVEVIGHAGQLRMKELAEQMGLTTGTITLMVDRLEKHGAAIRKPHENDRRSILVALTEKGKKLFEEHHKLHMKLTTDLCADLTDSESELLATLLAKMNSQI
ncbi:MAG: MarR family transcriptional regulator [Deltaproteobacteria bacterium]|nr:MarR family transcriptional regulator [Deltaproteobacteria bacterium]